MSTAFAYKGVNGPRVCKNQDVIYPGVHMYTNQRGVCKTALLVPPSVPLSWVSLYGSLTISQVGKEYPNGGMNEAGLVVEQTTLWSTLYPEADERPAVNELQWMQYLLDTCNTVVEALASAADIRIDQGTSRLHYLIADRAGDVAIVEFIHGRMCVHRDREALPIITNTDYESAVHESRVGVGNWSDRTDYGRNSMRRFTTVAHALKVDNKRTLGDEGHLFEILRRVEREDTVYSLIYNPVEGDIHVKTALYPIVNVVRLSTFDFEKTSAGRMANVQQRVSRQGELVFDMYTAERNMAAVHSFFRDPALTSVFKWQIPDEWIRSIAYYPDSFT